MENKLICRGRGIIVGVEKKFSLLRKVGHDVDIWARPISAQKVPESVLVYWTRDLLRASANNIPTDLY
jgi:hypothetical protein